MPELDDELIARALHAELNGTVEASSAHNADAELAKRRDRGELHHLWSEGTSRGCANHLPARCASDLRPRR